jgi:hypothetical protein
VALAGQELPANAFSVSFALPRATASCSFASRYFTKTPAAPPSTASTTAADSAATSGFRLTHFAARSARPTGRAAIGSPAWKRRKSSARAAALA